MKIIYLLVFVLFSLFISGCNITTQGEPFTETEFHRGTKGLSIGFDRDITPNEIVKDSAFGVGVIIQNLGASDIKNGFLVISDIESDYFDVLDDTLINYNLEGRGLINPKGEKKVFIFSMENKGIPKKIETNSFFTVSSCYDYVTEASTEVCVKPISLDGKRISQDVCEVKGTNLGSQGAPVAVTGIEENIVPEKGDTNSYRILFNIVIQNLGDGIVVGRDDYENICRGLAPREQDLDEIKISAKLSGNDLECKKLITGEKMSSVLVFSCSVTMNQQESYTTPLTINLEYGYVTKKIPKVLRIKQFLSAEDFCAPDNCIEASRWGVCDPIYGEENEELNPSCGDGMKCCTKSKSLCEDFASNNNEAYECLNINDCDSETIQTGLCAGDSTVKCCIKGEGSCSKKCADSASACNNGYGGVNNEEKCTGGKVCCKDTKTCEDFDDFSCITDEHPKYDSCPERKSFYCAGANTKCCKTS